MIEYHKKDSLPKTIATGIANALVMAGIGGWIVLAWVIL